MEELEISAASVEEAIKQALKKLGVSREEVEVTVVNEAKPGIMGIGAEEARIKVKPLIEPEEEKTDIAERARGILEELLAAMGVEASVLRASPVDELEASAPAPIAFDIEGEDLGILIGRRGQALSSLQFMVRLIMAHQTKTWLPIVIDVCGYKKRRYETLRAMAWRMAEQVRLRGAPLALRPMPAHERRVIHLALADYLDVITESTGEGEARKVVILPRER